MLFSNNRLLRDSVMWCSTVGYPSDSLASYYPCDSGCVCLSVCVSGRRCIMTQRCVLEQKLLLTALRSRRWGESIVTKINDLGLFIYRVRSFQPLPHNCRWIPRKPLEIEAWFQRTTNMKWPMGNPMVTSHETDDVTWPRKVMSWPNAIRTQCTKTAGDAI